MVLINGAGDMVDVKTILLTNERACFLCSVFWQACVQVQGGGPGHLNWEPPCPSGTQLGSPLVVSQVQLLPRLRRPNNPTIGDSDGQCLITQELPRITAILSFSPLLYSASNALNIVLHCFAPPPLYTCHFILVLITTPVYDYDYVFLALISVNHC